MIVFVTGASSGLGKCVAEKFACEGHRVYGTTRSETSRGEITAFGSGSLEMITLDVNDEQSCADAVSYVLSRESRIDVLINNAGFGMAGPLEFTDAAEAQRQFETNFFGALRMIRHVLPSMRANRLGKILNTSSVAAIIPIPFQSLYSASKVALEVATQALAMEVKGYGIKISNIEYGDMKTGFTQNRNVAAGVAQDEAGEKVYTATFDKSIEVMIRDEQNGPAPEKAAEFMYKVACKTNPKPVYIFGMSYKLVGLLRRATPMRFSNWIIGKIYA